MQVGGGVVGDQIIVGMVVRLRDDRLKPCVSKSSNNDILSTVVGIDRDTLSTVQNSGGPSVIIKIDFDSQLVCA